jgi:hypothetical protein
MTGTCHIQSMRPMGVVERAPTSKRATGETMKKTYLVIAGLAIAGTMLASTPASAKPDRQGPLLPRRFHQRRLRLRRHPGAGSL